MGRPVAGAEQADHQIAFAHHGSEDLDVARGISRGAKAGGHGFGGARVVA